MSYGWVRTEIVGALINACCLVSLCLFIVLEAIPKFITPQAISVDVSYLTVAAVGPFINIAGAILLFCAGAEHEEASGGHVLHYDADDDVVIEMPNAKKTRSPSKKPRKRTKKARNPKGDEAELDEYIEQVDNADAGSDGEQEKTAAKKKKKAKKSRALNESQEAPESESGTAVSTTTEVAVAPMEEKGEDMNMWAVLIHLAGDALSSAVVLVTAILVYIYHNKPNTKWTQYLDPTSSIIIAGIMLWSSAPLVLRCAKVLLQRVPESVKLAEIRQTLMDVPNVSDIHDLHVWQLTDGLNIATVHVRITSVKHAATVFKACQRTLHGFNIHCNTIQLEYKKQAADKADSDGSSETAPLMHISNDSSDDE